MATRDELAAGINFLVQEVRRLANDLADDQWERVVDIDGWKNREVLAHIAGVGTLVVPMSAGFTNAQPGQDALGGANIDQINAAIVAQRAGRTAAELADEAAKAYAGVTEWLATVPQETLDKRVTALGYRDVPMSDILMRMVVLHGFGHIYSVYASIFNSQ